MCWICDGIAPKCRFATVQSIEHLLLCGPEEEDLDDLDLEAEFPEVFDRTRECGVQCGDSLTLTPVERQRAEPRKRTISPGAPARHRKSRVKRDR